MNKIFTSLDVSDLNFLALLITLPKKQGWKKHLSMSLSLFLYR